MHGIISTGRIEELAAAKKAARKKVAGLRWLS
jgi:hypothetical protein